MATKNFDITKISDTQKKQLKKTGSYTDRMNRQRSSDGSVVNAQGQVDVSKVPDNVEVVDVPNTNLRDMSIAFSGKATPEQMAEISSRDPELSSRASQYQNTGTFVNEGTSTQSTEPLSPTDQLLAEKQKVDAEIRTLEERMMNQNQSRSDAYEGAGVFDDMRALNKLKDEQRRIQDRAIEIPIEGKQQLRGRTATKNDFNQLTGEAVENNLMNQLAISRQVSSFSDSIETNLAIIDTQLKGQNDRDQFLYEKKVGQLNAIQSAYSNIITEEQKEAIEFQKFQYDLLLESSKADNDLRNGIIKEFATSGKFSGSQLQGVMDMSVDELLGMSYETTSPFNWTNLSPEDAALYLDEDTYDRYTAYTEQKSTLTAEEDAAFKMKSANLQTANSTVDLIEEMLLDKQGLKTSVGEGALGRVDYSVPFTGFGKESNKFRANMKQLLSQKTLDKLLELKAAGGTLGAISEKELDILGKAAVALGSVETKDGLASGKSNLSEAEFNTAMETLRMASMKVYIAERIGSKAYNAAGYVDMTEEDFDTVEKRYQDLRATPIGQTQDYSETELKNPQNLETAFNVIREEEGLRTEAYQDQTGTWTIGIGNTQINGRPVRPGDRLTEPQAEALMQKSVVQNYTKFSDTISTDVTPNQFAALTSFEYNLGSGVWQTDTGRQILALVNQDRNDEAGRLMLQYNKHRDPRTGELVINNVLAQRRMREANLLLA